MSALLPLDEAQTKLLNLTRRLPLEAVQLSDSFGRYLAAPLRALRTQPTADLSAMDGYAISGDGPWTVIGESRAGAPFAAVVAAHQAVRISTGAHVPTGADRILIQENAERNAGALNLTGEMPPEGKHIRMAGFDFNSGATLLEAGTRLGAAQIALALTAGHAAIETARKPVITILDSGDELASDPANCLPHQVPASNAAMLAAMIAPIPCDVKRLGPIPDRLEALTEVLHKATASDLIITTGGASVGDHDLIRPALKAAGAQLSFYQAAIKPGKPLLVATRGSQIVVGLPGNPVSSFTTAFLFVLPLLRKMVGAAQPLPRTILRKTLADLPPTGNRREFIRAQDDGHGVTPLGEQDSSALLALSHTNAMIERPEGSAEVKAGTNVPVYLLENG